MTQSPIIAFPKLFIGMDIHKKSWSLLLRTDLFNYKGFAMPQQPQTLVDYVSSHFDGHDVSLTYEAGCCGFPASLHSISMGWHVRDIHGAILPSPPAYKANSAGEFYPLLKRKHFIKQVTARP